MLPLLLAAVHASPRAFNARSVSFRLHLPCLGRATLPGGYALGGVERGVVLLQLFAQALETRTLVLELTALATAHYRDAARPVTQAYRAVGGVHALPTRSGGAEDPNVALGKQIGVIGGDVVAGVVHALMIREAAARGAGATGA